VAPAHRPRLDGAVALHTSGVADARSPALRRLAVSAVAGAVTAAVAALVASWQLAVLLGWDGAALVYVLWTLPVLRHDGTATEAHAAREDETRRTADALLLGVSVVSLVAVGAGLAAANRAAGGEEVLLTAASAATVVLSWCVVQTVHTLHYASLYYRPPAGGVDFGGLERPDYRDFAYLAFTVGMTYQVSDTNLSSPEVRRRVLGHALLSYVFGTVIIATTINIVASLLR
jgi:uncharacterized membrane protein